MAKKESLEGHIKDLFLKELERGFDSGREVQTKWSPNNLRRVYISPKKIILQYHTTGTGIGVSKLFGVVDLTKAPSKTFECLQDPNYKSILSGLLGGNGSRVTSSVEDIIFFPGVERTESGVFTVHQQEFNLGKLFRSSDKIHSKFPRLISITSIREDAENFINMNYNLLKQKKMSFLDVLESSDLSLSSSVTKLPLDQLNTNPNLLVETVSTHPGSVSFIVPDDRKWWTQFRLRGSYYDPDKETGALHRHFYGIQGAKNKEFYNEKLGNIKRAKSGEVGSLYKDQASKTLGYIRALMLYTKFVVEAPTDFEVKIYKDDITEALSKYVPKNNTRLISSLHDEEGILSEEDRKVLFNIAVKDDIAGADMSLSETGKEDIRTLKSILGGCYAVALKLIGVYMDRATLPFREYGSKIGYEVQLEELNKRFTARVPENLKHLQDEHKIKSTEATSIEDSYISCLEFLINFTVNLNSEKDFKVRADKIKSVLKRG